MERNKLYDIRNISFSRKSLNIQINGENLSFELEKISSVLPIAKREELNSFKVSLSGYGIHWPLLDEDISIPSLLAKS